MGTIRVESALGKSKRKELSDSLAAMIRSGELGIGEALPSINSVCRDFGVSRDTVTKAYALLKRQGLVESFHGKDFHVISSRSNESPRTLILLDELSMYKKRLVEGIQEELGPNSETAVFCHGNSLDTLKTLYLAYAGKYEATAVIPSYELEESLRFLKSISSGPVVVIDRFDPAFSGSLPAVYQDFEAGVAEALAKGLDRLRKYRRLVLLIDNQTSHISRAIVRGFETFLAAHGFSGEIVKEASPRRGDAWIVVSDENLVSLIKSARSQGLSLGSDLGVVSYNDTPLKEIIESGLSVITTDFRKMGELAGGLLKTGDMRSMKLGTDLILRGTL